MITSSNGKNFRITGPLCGEFTGPGEFPAQRPVNSPHKGQWRGALMFSLICAWINDWVNNHEAGDFRRHRGHYDVNIMSPDTVYIRKLPIRILHIFGQLLRRKRLRVYHAIRIQTRYVDMGNVWAYLITWFKHGWKIHHKDWPLV